MSNGKIKIEISLCIMQSIAHFEYLSPLLHFRLDLRLRSRKLIFNDINGSTEFEIQNRIVTCVIHFNAIWRPTLHYGMLFRVKWLHCNTSLVLINREKYFKVLFIFFLNFIPDFFTLKLSDINNVAWIRENWLKLRRFWK